MKKKQVNAMLVDQVKRKHKIISYICVILVLTILFASFLFLFTVKNRIYYVNYKEDSDLDYKVYLKQNDFFKDSYLGRDHQYIASLIDYIDVDFDYYLKIEDENVDYQYSYLIEADVKVNEKNSDKTLYNYSDILEQRELIDSNGQSNIEIQKSLNVDYNYYNNLINKFVNIYDLDDVESTLTISMYVTFLGNCDSVDFSNNESVISLVIPLTTKTVEIDMSYDLLDENTEGLMVCKPSTESSVPLIIMMLIIGGLDAYLILKLGKYIVVTRTAESIYEKELKKILNNYKSYIQKINNEFDLGGYQVLKVDTFTDMLEIRDTIGEPILMVENKEKTGVYFLIPSKTKILYSYGLKVSDIREKMGKCEDGANG